MPMISKDYLYRFGAFELDTSLGELRRSGVRLPLQGQPLQVLEILLSSPQQLVSREQLRQALWPDGTFVNFDDVLNHNMRRLRHALEDDVDSPRFIETLPRRGYRFLGTVEVSRGTARRCEAADSRRAEKWTWPVSGAIAAVVMAVAGMAFIGWETFHGRIVRSDKARLNAPPISSSKMRVVPLTTLPNAAWGPAISPDGQKIVFLWDGENRLRGDIYEQLIGGGKPLRLTHTRSGYICCVDWSPDGQQIAFARCDDDGGSVLVVPVLGGQERKLTDVSCSYGRGGYPKWTRDGDSLVLADRCALDTPVGIVVFSLDTGNKRCLHSPSLGDLGDWDPVLSPDGRTVAFLRCTTAFVSDLYTVSLRGGDLRRLTQENTGEWGVTWSTDSQRIVFTSDRSGLSRVWQVPASGGSIELETVYPATGSLSRDGRRLVYEEPSNSGTWSPMVWRVELSGQGGRVIAQDKIVSSSGDNEAVQLSPDGHQIVFASNRSGKQQIWKSNADGSDPQQLTFFKGWAGTPRWSPDTKSIVFDVQIDTHAQISLMDANGRNQHDITFGEYNNVAPSWSRDGTAVYFASNRTGRWEVWRLELASRRVTQFTHSGGFIAFESYDSKTVYYSKFEMAGLWSMSASGGVERPISKAPHYGYGGHIAVTDAGIYLLDTEAQPAPSIMYYKFRTRRLRPVITLKEDPILWGSNLTASRDGRTLLFSQSPLPQGSISMVENFQ